MTKSIFWQNVTFPNNIVDLTGIGNQGVVLPSGTNAERPLAPVDGTIRYNTTINRTEIYQGGVWSDLATGVLGGETNTASNLGAGQPVFASKVGADLQFRSIVAGSNISVSSNASEITINATAVGEPNTASNVGIGTGNVFAAKAGIDLQFKTLRSLNPNLTITDNVNTVDFNFTGGVGETNTASNLGAGSQVFANKVAADLRFRSLQASANEITLVQSASEIEIGISDNPVIPGSASMVIPTGPAGSEPAPIDGMIRYDTTANAFRAVVNGTWETVETSAGTFLPISGGSMTGDLLLDPGVNLVGGIGSQIQLEGQLIITGGASIDLSTGGNILMQAGNTVDGRDVSADGNVVDSINQTGSFGLISRTADPDSYARRTIVGTANQILVTAGDGVSGNPSIAMATNPIVPGVESITIPFGTTAQRPVSLTNGIFRVNTDDQTIEYYIGGSWLRPINQIGGAVVGDIDMDGNDIDNVNFVDGRNLSADGAIIDDLAAITSNTGVVVKSSGNFITRLIQPSATISELGAVVNNGDGSNTISIGFDITGLPAFSPLIGTEEIAIYDTVGGSNSKIIIDDILTYIGSSGLGAEVDVAGEFGFLARISDGVVGDFERRTFTASTTITELGIIVTNGDGIAGDPVIGLDINGLPASGSPLDEASVLPVYDPVGATNAGADMPTMRSTLLSGMFRASDSIAAIPSGVSTLAFTIGASDFDPDGLFDDATDSYTPLAGYYKIGAYLEASASATAGRYTVQIVRNGTAEGNIGVLDADGTNLDSVQIEDLFNANGTDSFTVEVNNPTGGASTLDVVRFYAHRIY